MATQILGRASAQGLEDIQPTFCAWIKRVLAEEAPDGQYLIVLRGFLNYAEPMLRIRIHESRMISTDVIIEVFPPASAEGLCYLLYTPEGIDRGELVKVLNHNVSSFA